nr:MULTISPECIES: MSMEG_6728 family protein [unclassified Rathayibacter]
MERVQTFLPFADLRASARALDSKRLGKQRVETLQIMRALTVPGYGWQNHPAVRMWRGHRPAVMAYQRETCDAWTDRGFADTCLEKTEAALAAHPDDLALYRAGTIELPPWFGRDDVHLSHRSKLVEKDPEHYAPLFPGTLPGLDYVWPVGAV